MPKSKTRKRRAQPRPVARTRTGPASDYQRWRGEAKLYEFDAWLTRTWTVRGLTIALMLALCVGIAFAIALHTVQREQDLFEKAPYCGSATDTGCKLELTATIQRKGETGGKSPRYYLDLVGPQPADGRFNLPEESSLWDSAASGDSVTAIVWNGAVMRIVDGGQLCNTDDAPAIGITRLTALLSSAGVCILALVMLLVRVLQVGRANAYGWSRLLVPFNLVALSAALLFPIGAVAGSQFESTTVSLLCGAGLTSFAAIYVLVNWLRNR